VSSEGDCVGEHNSFEIGPLCRESGRIIADAAKQDRAGWVMGGMTNRRIDGFFFNENNGESQ